MLRALVLATLFLVVPRPGSGQPLSVLHISIALLDGERKTTPVPRHALLISDNPASTIPRRIVTALDGTADVRLRPGSYTVESDRPVAFQGKAYQWTQIVEIAAGRDAVLELTAANADVAAASSISTTDSAGPAGGDPTALLMQWQDGVVALWTPTAHGSGFLFDANGLIATNQRVIGAATSVEVEIAPNVKIAARVLAADSARDVAVLWIDPKAAGSVRPMPLGCAQTVKPSVMAGETLFAIGTPLREQKSVSSGTVSRMDANAIVSDLILASGSTGGPVFAVGGGVVGLTSVAETAATSRRADIRVVRVDDVCDVVASAEQKMKDAAPPDGTQLPIEPARPLLVAALKEAAQKRAGSLNPYQITSSDFEVAFITPVQIYGAQYQAEQAARRARRTEPDPALMRPLMDFSNWSEYVSDLPPVLLVRVTPKLVQSFWTTVARGAAQTQGVSIPAIKHVKSGFSRLRAFCGDDEVTPIHPFKLEQRVSDNEAIDEGLYVFDPGAFPPQCATVKLVLYSEKQPDKGETRVVDPKVLQQIWQDFAPYRDLK